MQNIWLAVIGLLGGITSGLFGVGGGILFVPLLVILKKADMHTAVATSLAVIVPTAIAALGRHHFAGKVEWQTAMVIAVFAIAGAWMGASLCLRLDTVLLRRFFALFLMVFALRLFFRG